MGYYDLPNLLNVPGEDLPKVLHYLQRAAPLLQPGRGGRRREELGGDQRRWSCTGLAARVTLIHRGDAVGEHVKYWIKPNLENRIKNGEINAYFRSAVQEIRQHSILVAAPEGELSLKNDFVFAMIGYRPDLKFLDAHGIPIDGATGRPRTNSETLESARLEFTSRGWSWPACTPTKSSSKTAASTAPKSPRRSKNLCGRSLRHCEHG